MASPEWVRLYHGRLWHIASVLSSLTECGEEFDPAAEHRPEFADQVPVNGHVCERCVRELVELADQAKAALARDPRQEAARVQQLQLAGLVS